MLELCQHCPASLILHLLVKLGHLPLSRRSGTLRWLDGWMDRWQMNLLPAPQMQMSPRSDGVRIWNHGLLLR